MFQVILPHRLTVVVSLALGLALIGAASASAGSVRTVDGRVFDGDLRFDNDKLQITPRRGPPVKLDVADLLLVSFRSADPARASQPQPTRPAGEGQLPGNWKPQDVGNVGTPGDVRFYNGVYAVKGAGTNVYEKADSFYFVPQELSGDCSVTARVIEMQLGDGYAKAGVMIRSSLDASAKHMYICATPRDGTTCLWRTDSGNATSRTPYLRGEEIPLWLRVTRRQNTLTSFRSADGLNWIQVEQREILLEQRAFVGLAVCSHNKAGSFAATFDNVTVQPGTPRDDEPGRRGGGPAVAPLSRAIIFRRGTILANVQFQSANSESVRLQRPDGKQATIPAADVARLILAPVPPSTVAKIPDRGTGVLLARGDFMEGELLGFADGRVRLSSVLFGLSNFAAGSEAAVLVLNDPQPTRSTWVVRATDGSVYYAGGLKIDHDQLLIDDDSAGPVKVSVWNLLEIKAGEARFDPLSELKPVKIEPGDTDATKAYTAGPATPAARSLPATLATTLVATRAGTSITYDLDGKYKVFLARAGVPEGTLPTIAVRYSVLVDGVEAFHSTPHTSLDDPAVVSVNLAGAKTITLRVDPPPAGLPATVLWADPALMK